MIKTKDIQNNRLKQIVEDYFEIQSWLVEHRKRLELLKKDHELLIGEPPYKINFAVDFLEIYRLVFPLECEKEIKDVKNSDKEAWFYHKVVSQTGRICLFYGIETETLPVPVLLPPYRDELDDFLFWLKVESNKDVEPSHVISKLKESIQTALHDEGIEFKGKGEPFELSDEHYEKIIEFIKKYFFQLSILLMGGYNEEFSILKSLFSNSDKRIEMVSDRWSEYSVFINEEINKIPDAWNDFIRIYRKENHDDFQNRQIDISISNKSDLLALHLIKALNRKFKEENKKEIVLLVSDAKIFKNLLNNTPYDDVNDKTISGVVKTATGEEIAICRNTDIFHTYLLVKKKRKELKDQYKQEFSVNPHIQTNRITLINVEDDLRKIKLIEEFENDFDRIIEYCNQNGNDCQNSRNCTKKNICLKTKKVIKDFQKDRKSLESLSLAENFDIYAKIYKRYQQIFDFNEEAHKIVKLLQQNHKTICNKINKILEDLRKRINQGFEGLVLDSIYVTESEPDVLKIHMQNSFRIKTYVKEIDEIIGNIQKSIRQNDQDKFSFYFSALKNKREQLDKTKPLKYLTSSLIAAAYEKYDLALYFLKTELIFTVVKTPLYREIKYLETIIYCNNKEYKKALTLCKELLKNYQDDYRFPYFCGYVILRGKDADELIGCSYEESVEYCSKALSMVKETGNEDWDLQQDILDNLNYGLSKISTLKEKNKDYLEIINRLVKEIGKELIPLKIKNVFKTINGYVLEKKRLIGLNLCGMRLSIIPDLLREFKDLTHVNLGSNQIRDISVLKGLKNLTGLHLYNNQIKDISALKDLKNLTVLYLGANQITDISALKYLKNLTEVWLNRNQITDISAIKDLKNLTEVWLNRNQITDISALKDLKKLTELNLCGNKISRLPYWVIDLILDVGWKLIGEGISLEDNPLEIPPVEIVKKGKKAISKWFKSPEGKKVTLNLEEKVDKDNYIKQLNILKVEFIELTKLAPIKRGFEFEKFLNQLFKIFDLNPKEPFRNKGEQIDGSFLMGNDIYLVEAKWQDKHTRQDDLLIFDGKVSRKAKWTRGLFISMAGFTEDGQAAFSTGQPISIIGMDSHDLEYILNNELTLIDAIRLKLRCASETNKCFVPLRDLIKK